MLPRVKRWQAWAVLLTVITACVLSLVACGDGGGGGGAGTERPDVQTYCDHGNRLYIVDNSGDEQIWGVAGDPTCVE